MFKNNQENTYSSTINIGKLLKNVHVAVHCVCLYVITSQAGSQDHTVKLTLDCSDTDMHHILIICDVTIDVLFVQTVLEQKQVNIVCYC